ncbi:23S rRNA (adenine2503-C2)-methyltransferase [Ereboglobus sp. PH5-10]|uniref:23S rRNA (adenine(2503)-C(2))-methyltransferase RlmN n=1 Tax=Ereboglobus sp. PH5-10 TaxID=2940629 RepID=UPI0024053676|nr:23S rRNA (adenine(2503)-C(2))-methyltransferase RlmN [Ereboglobus sp. PH5-10]MDF9826160.1 23S rRNA (adenine2503-C2)-methyltransferase [Ereboglobus sp. PH5-10]
MTSLADFSVEEFARHIEARGYKPAHAARVLKAFYEGDGSADFDALKLPSGLAEHLRGFANGCEIATRQQAEDGTVKVLLRLADGRTVEAVMMTNFAPDSAAGCVSSQVGCAMGCDFCATTKTGFERNLTAGEMVGQFLAVRREAAMAGRRLQTLVFMGMGEPMLNLDAVLEAVRRIAPNGMGNLGWRQITVSTVGIVPGIDAMAAADLNIHLAVSLHAPDDATRARLLPAGKRFRVEDILAAADRYQAKTKRIVTIQYCLLKGVNDSPAQAHQLAALLKGRRMHVNLLRYNPTGTSLSGAAYAGADEETAMAFLKVLRESGAVAHFRRPRGRDIDAACGQLRKRAGDAR